MNNDKTKSDFPRRTSPLNEAYPEQVAISKFHQQKQFDLNEPFNKKTSP